MYLKLFLEEDKKYRDCWKNLAEEIKNSVTGGMQFNIENKDEKEMEVKQNEEYE